MKELEQIHDAPGSRVLKSLLKKPGQGNRQRKNRVVINEKLNEFFAADYIILIKEECCADYEEECDCCCQEPEMIRLGNCKECRAEMARHLAGEGPDPRHDRNGQIDVDNLPGSNNEESQCEDDDEDEEEEYEEEVDDDDDEAESSEEVDRVSTTPPSQHEPQQQETLSPPEGYKDVCDEETNAAMSEVPEDLGQVVVCGECNYYRQRASDGEECTTKASDTEASSGDTQEPDEESGQQTSEQSQHTTPDIHQQRYVVETITMTTVTERRIVREISEEKPVGLDQTDARGSSTDQNNSNDLAKDSSVDLSELTAGEEDKKLDTKRQTEVDKEPTDSTEMSMTFKLGNVSLVTNSCKPNSAVRQLFPNQRLISQPPVLAKVSSVLSTDEATDSDGSERYLVTTESLRLFDSVKRAKMAGSRSDSSESDSSTIRRTIERNALRRSLVCKFDSTGKKKNLMSKDLTLEERIRQLTCVDQDEDTTGDSASESAAASECIGMPELKQELPVRTSPSGEERPLRNERVVRPLINSQEHSSPSPPLHHHHHHHHYHHHHHQSTYKKITDLFGPKKIENMPDLGLGDRTTLAKSSTKLTSDARKQFLASLAPLSCVASTGVDSQDYYQLSSKASNRDSMSYNSDSSYSLEDIDAVLRGDEKNCKNSPGPPDVTRGTPTGTGPNDITDTTTDELLAFVEQDKTRTERLKRRYDTDDHQELVEKTNGILNDDEDDELNDYGFNRRPSVRGIKPQFESTSEIVRQLRYRTFPVSIADSRMVVPPPAWPYYDTDSVDKRVTFIQEPEEINGKTRDNTINRINTMQRQIDDIYQTIAETAVSVQGNIERGSYLESTLPRTVPRPASTVPPPECHRYEQKNGAHFQDHTAQRLRMSEVSATSAYNNTLPGKNRRAPVAFSNYPCGVMPVENTKCYRTIYLVPNGLADPTYQNIQRILPPHSSPNYATHIERYPYPKNPRSDDHPQPPPRYYPRTPPGHTAGISPSITAPQPLHLHLHQPDEGFAASTIGMQTVQLQHHQHISQLATYNVQSVPAYTVMAPSRPPQEYHPYSIHPGRGAADMQTQTNSLSSAITSTGAFNGSSQHLVSVSASSATSSVLSSPTKMHPMSSLCSAAERGVPEGAASAPAHDFVSQNNNNITGHVIGNSFVGHSNNVPPPNTQNSVYYAMNVCVGCCWFV